MPVQMATGKNLKKISVFIDKHGNKNPGTFYENVNGANTGGHTATDRSTRKSKKAREA